MGREIGTGAHTERARDEEVPEVSEGERSDLGEIGHRNTSGVRPPPELKHAFVRSAAGLPVKKSKGGGSRRLCPIEAVGAR